MSKRNLKPSGEGWVQLIAGIGFIGRGTHERFVINNEKFMAKVASRANSN